LGASCSCGETDYYWALDMVSSRTFCVERGEGGGCLYGMYPLADMFNHRFGSTQLSISKGCFSIVKEEDVRAGEQILVSYGAIDNSWLLQVTYTYPTTMHVCVVMHTCNLLCVTTEYLLCMYVPTHAC
jgi:hypothetical protein